MKKALKFIALVMVAGLVTAGFLVFDRYRKNTEQVFPYPYEFKGQSPSIKLDAPILIVGDRMGAYFAKFHSDLAATISTNLAKPIGVQSLAKNGHALHRTLHELRSLVQWPQILIYQGASEEFNELKFNSESGKTIQKNFELYKDERLETAMILKPWLSRIIYHPHQKIALEDAPQIMVNVEEADYLKRLETEILLFEQQLIQLINLSKDRNTLLILTTTPINLDIEPHRVCGFTQTYEIEQELINLKKLMEENNPKAAYALSSRLILQYAGNAKLFFVHGQISRRLGYLEEAKNSLLQASAFDCDPWRATEVYNSIIRRVAKNNQVILFDFAKLLDINWNTNTTFFDEIYPQNLYYEQAMKELGLVIKQILKL